MNDIVSAAADLAINSTYEPPPSYAPTGSAADTAFSGSAILELRLTPPPAPPKSPLVVLKHSTVRANSVDPSDESKLKAAQKVDTSSINEYAYLTAYSASTLGPSVKIPETLFARNHPTEGVTLLLESMSTWSQVPVIPLGDKLTNSLKWLANFHASFLPPTLNPSALDPDKITQLGGWEIGTHLSLEKRPENEPQRLPNDISEFAERFEEIDDYFKTESARNQGNRLLAVAEDAANFLNPKDHPNITMVHGDYKQGNFFFNDSEDICVFDWQWTGPGLGATDLIYLCAMAVSDDVVVDHETNIIKPYHNFLIEALGGDSTVYPYSTFLKEFKISTLDYQRWQGGSRLKSMTPETLKKAGENVDVNHGIFRRSLERVKWIFKVVDGVLDEVESGSLNFEC